MPVTYRKLRRTRRSVLALEVCEARLLMATAPPLGLAVGFAALGGSTVTNTGATMIVGDVGVSPGTSITGFPPGVVSEGLIRQGGPVATQAEADLATAYTSLAGEAVDTILSGQDLGGQTLAPGVYQFSSAAQMNGKLTFDAQGNPDAVLVIQIGTTLTTGTNSSVALTNGARACNIYWQVGTSATLGTGTAFKGSILAFTSITLNTGASISPGRALAISGGVTMDTNAITNAATSGTVYLDINANGSPDVGEGVLAGRVVFADLNHDGAFSPFEPTATTDIDGHFTLNGAVAGTDTVLEAAALDTNRRHVVDQFLANLDGTLSIGVVPISTIAPVPVVPNPFTATPTSNPDAAFVQSLYHAVLGRVGGDGEVATWLAQMTAGMTRTQVAAGFVNSLEHRQDQVAVYYEDFLHRAPDPGSSAWVDELLSGVSEEKVAEAILNSPEYQRTHLDPTLFIQDLYLDVLGRQGDPNGIAGWQSVESQGATRQAIVASFVESPEASDQIVTSFYVAYLHRLPEHGPSDVWVTMLESPGGSATAVAADILAGGEFIRDAVNPNG